MSIISQKKHMIANVDRSLFVPLEDNLEAVNIAQLRKNLVERYGVSISYPSLRNLMRGVVETVNGFQLLDVTPIPKTHFQPMARPILHHQTDKKPVPVEKGGKQADILQLLVRGITITELKKRFPNAVSDDQIIKDITYYVNNFGYDTQYSTEEHVLQLVLPEGQDDITLKQ